MESVRERVRANLERLILESGMTQKEISEKLGISSSAVNHWVKGRYSPDIDVLIAFCELLHVPLNAVYDFTPLIPEPNEKQNQLLRLFSGLDESDQNRLLEYATLLANQRK